MRGRDGGMGHRQLPSTPCWRARCVYGSPLLQEVGRTGFAGGEGSCGYATGQPEKSRARGCLPDGRNDTRSHPHLAAGRCCLPEIGFGVFVPRLLERRRLLTTQPSPHPSSHLKSVTLAPLSSRAHSVISSIASSRAGAPVPRSPGGVEYVSGVLPLVAEQLEHARLARSCHLGSFARVLIIASRGSRSRVVHRTAPADNHAPFPLLERAQRLEAGGQRGTHSHVRGQTLSAAATSLGRFAIAQGTSSRDRTPAGSGCSQPATHLDGDHASAEVASDREIIAGCRDQHRGGQLHHAPNAGWR